MSERVDHPSYDHLKPYQDDPCYICFWTSPSFVCGCGHISLILPNMVYISFWPKADVGCFDIKHYACTSKFYREIIDEIEEKGYPDKIVKLYGLDENAITSWWNAFTKHAKYDLWRQNCATVVLSALRQGNPWFKKSSFDKIKTPSDVFYIVKEQFNENMIAKLPPAIFGKYALLCFTTHILRNSYYIHTHATEPVFNTSCNCITSLVHIGMNLVCVICTNIWDHKKVTYLRKTLLEYVAPRHSVTVVPDMDLGKTIIDESELVQTLQPPNLLKASTSRTFSEKKSLVTQPREG